MYKVALVLYLYIVFIYNGTSYYTNEILVTKNRQKWALFCFPVSVFVHFSKFQVSQLKSHFINIKSTTTINYLLVISGKYISWSILTRMLPIGVADPTLWH